MRYLLLLGLILTACVDKISLPTPEQPERGILLQGKLTAGNPALVQVTLFELYQYEQNRPKGLPGAKVRIEAGNGVQQELGSTGNGQFGINLTTEAPGFPVTVGEKYRIVASLPNGQTYTSDWETIQNAPEVTSVTVDSVFRQVYNDNNQLINEKRFLFSISTPVSLPGATQPQRLLWEMDQSYKITDLPTNGADPKTCYAFAPMLTTNMLLNNPAGGSADLVNFPVFETPVDYRFSEGYYLLFYQHAISENAFNYFTELNQLLAKKGTLFDPPAGSIRTNISSNNPDELVYGFFWVSRPDTAFLAITPATAGNPKKFCPLPPRANPVTEGNPPLTACDNCFIEPGGTLEKPYWWNL